MKDTCAVLLIVAFPMKGEDEELARHLFGFVLLPFPKERHVIGPKALVPVIHLLVSLCRADNLAAVRLHACRTPTQSRSF
jgi:hypothetical protein